MSRHVWRRAAPPTPTLGMAVRGCRQREEAEPPGRTAVHGRSTVQAATKRLYSAALAVRPRVRTGAKALRIPQRRLYQEKIPAQTPQKGLIKKKSGP